MPLFLWAMGLLAVGPAQSQPGPGRVWDEKSERGALPRFVNFGEETK
jgi:hypothetical protein